MLNLVTTKVINFDNMSLAKVQYIWAILRLLMGWIFLWAFFDKVFGLGFSTAPDKSWLSGTSPTFGFLKFATHGPFASFYQSLASNTFVEWSFMLGLLLIGVALIVGIGVKVAGYSGALMMFLLWSAVLPPEHNPVIDDHIINIIILVALASVGAGRYLGLGGWWSNTRLVKKYKFLE